MIGSSRRGKDGAEGRDKRLPLPAALAQFSAAFGCEAINPPACAASSVLFFSQDSLNFASRFEAIECGVKRSFFEAEQSAAVGLEAAEDFQSVRGPALERG